MKGKRKIAFVLFLVVGNITLGLYASYYLGKDTVLESIAVFTSISTAVYAILNEPPKEKAEPLLRVEPRLRAGFGMGSLGLEVRVDNIGDAPAKNTQVVCKINPQSSISLENDGVYTIPLLAPKEYSKINPIISIQSDQLTSQELAVEVAYSNLENKKQPSMRESYSISVLRKNLETKMLTRDY